jgi:beta-1,4-mannosyltransferase
LIAGSPSTQALGVVVTDAAAGDARIRMDLRFLPADDLQLHLNAADLLVLPYREVLNSGSAILALSFNRPVLIPRQGALSDLTREIGDVWIRTYDGDLTPSVLAEAAEWGRSPRQSEAPLESLDWDHLADLTRCAYERVLSRTRPDDLGTTDRPARLDHSEVSECAPTP